MIKFDVKFVAALDLMLDVGEDDEGWEKLDLWHPPDKSMVRIVVTIGVGAVGMKGTNDFALEICTRPLLEKKGNKWKAEYVLVVDSFEWIGIKQMIKARIESCQRDTWVASVEELRKRFYWEYETFPPTRRRLKPLPASVFPKPPNQA